MLMEHPTVGWQTVDIYSSPLQWAGENFDWLVWMGSIGVFVHFVVLCFIVWVYFSYRAANSDAHLPTLFGSSY